MSQSSIVLVGAGGHALSCIDVIESQGSWQIRGLLGVAEEQGGARLGYPILGIDHDMDSFYETGARALVCVGQIKTAQLRIRLYNQLRQVGYVLPTIIAPTARVSPYAKVGAGTIIMHGAIVNADVNIGENNIINTRSVIEHGVTVGDHCHISTGVIINGNVKVGDGSFIGSGSIVKETLQIGQNCIIGMGTKLLSSLIDGSIFWEPN